MCLEGTKDISGDSLRWCIVRVRKLDTSNTLPTLQPNLDTGNDFVRESIGEPRIAPWNPCVGHSAGIDWGRPGSGLARINGVARCKGSTVVACFEALCVGRRNRCRYNQSSKGQKGRCKLDEANVAGRQMEGYAVES